MRVAVVAICFALGFGSSVADAQSVETPVPFDSARHIAVITPPVAARLQLASPGWPLQTEYREARLYRIEPGDSFVLVAERADGSLERHLLTAGQRAALGGSIDAALLTFGSGAVGLAADVGSEPAGNSFARRQTLLGAVVYGPLAASLADDGAVAGALYLATAGMSFFTSYGAAQSSRFTRAQSDLAGDMGLAATAGGWLLGYGITGNSDRPVRAVALGSGIVGTMAGVAAGEALTDAEAHATIAGVETGAAAAVLATSLANGNDRSMAIAAAAGGVLGLPLGLAYPRHAGYLLTPGDVESIGTSGEIGALLGGATLGDHATAQRTAATLGAGYLAGEVIGDQLLARPYDITRSQANILKFGAFAGALVGAAIPVLAGASSLPAALGAAAAGATLAVGGLVSSFSPGETRSPGGAARSRSLGRGTSFSVLPDVRSTRGILVSGRVVF